MGKKRSKYVYIPEDIKYYHNSKFNLTIKNSCVPDAGLGVFTNDFIPHNTHIDYYYGHIKRTDESVRSRYSFDLSNSDYFLESFINPRPYTAVINDAYKSKYDNNCKFVVNEKCVSTITDNDVDSTGKAVYLSVVSVRDIQKGEELFISYSSEYWN